ncbi:phage baseplate assembly protein V [Dictyobacter formicarum]|uniref:Type IV secretion protein Rhs n=1 Tax=Dictyobacter formicarum TaxID=2778368 RepID=A0ABQ3VBR3_9CHLR|nr:phage baseplate assembly protein V [Dictyobacter formicarum]GHO83199.1 type IV secretion protein Rhs [Dictyobacter formicarum]
MIDAFYAPHFDIRISGLTLSADVSNQITSISYDSDLDMASMFTITMRNPDNQFLDSALFDLGKRVEVYMGYGNDLHPMILGEITSLEPSFPESGAPALRISGYDLSYKMRNNQQDRSFQNVTDSRIAAQLAAEAGLIPIVDPSPIFHKDKVQHSGNDMALLKKLAKANFFEVYARWDKLYFQLPRPQTQAIVLEWGKNLSSFSPRISNTGLAGSQIVRSYNEELAQTIVAFAMAADFNPDTLQEKLGSSALDLLLSLGRRVLHKEKVESAIDASVIAQSMMQEILDGMYEGSGSCIGIPDLQAGQYITIQGIGKRFSGTYRIRKTTHTIDEGGYRTSFDVTQKNNTSLLPLLRKSLQEVSSPTGSEQFYGVAIGKVTQNNDTESGIPMGRVKISYPWLSDNAESGWARCATPMAGSHIGMYFLPEVGDEVLIAFEQGNLASPVIIGSLWNADQQPPTSNSDGQDNIRLIKTRSGHTITLDDTKGDEKIVIQDKGGSQVTMNQDGTVTISAAKDLVLKAKGSITLNADKNSGSITLGANKVDVNVTQEMNVS